MDMYVYLVSISGLSSWGFEPDSLKECIAERLGSRDPTSDNALSGATCILLQHHQDMWVC